MGVDIFTKGLAQKAAESSRKGELQQLFNTLHCESVKKTLDYID